MFFFVKVILSIILAVICHRIYLFYMCLDVGRAVYSHYPGPCQQVKGVDYGSENMYMFPDGLTFITSGFSLSQPMAPEYVEYYTKNRVKGRIFLFDFKKPEVAMEMTLTTTENFDRDRFQPHGISGWEDKKSGKRFLFIVNHEKDGKEKIEKFVISMESLSLEHVKTYSGDPSFVMLNDVAATSENSFYFTNFMSMSSKAGIIFESLARTSWSTIGYYNGETYRLVEHGLGTANGVDMSADTRTLYVALTGSRELRIYNRQQSDELQLREIFPLDSAPDNIVVDPITGHLYLGLHPVGHLIFGHMSDPRERSPSQVLQLKLKDGKVSSVSELFMDEGQVITGSAVAAVYNKKLLIGSLMDKLVYCDILVPFS